VANGPVDPLYGRAIALRLRLTAPKQRRSVGIALSFVVLLMAVTFAIDAARDPSFVFVWMVGAGTLGLLAFTFLRLSRADRASWRFELTDRHLVLPPPYLYLRRHVVVPFDQIVDLWRDASGAVGVIHRKGVGVLPPDCFPEGWDANYVAGRIAVRWELWRAGQRPTADQLAAIEAQMDHVDENGRPAIATWLMPAKEGRGPIVVATFAANGGERVVQPPTPPAGPAPPRDDEE
jgi:hypothetical protein